jgi:multiple sugar transport system substrate-binding protein
MQVAVTAAFAAGCGASTAGTASTAESLCRTGPITFATGQLATGHLPGLTAGWNWLHTGQRVTPIYLPDANDQLAQLATNLQARSDAYDVMSLDVIWTAQFASNGWIVPINRSSFPLADFLGPSADTAYYDGKLWTVPFTSNAELLCYRKDLLAKADVRPPATWTQRADLARTVARRYGLGGYGSQFADYEGLTVNFAETVDSAGGSILSPGSTWATVDSPQARAALGELVSGFPQGWIPRAALNWDEQASQQAFEAGKLLFLNNWPYVCGQASQPGAGSKVAGKVGVIVLPGPHGPGVSALGRASLAVSAFSRHPQTALAFVKLLTSLPSERAVLTVASLPPVWTRLYLAPALIRRFPYLPYLKKAILIARPRPETANYSQLSLAISSAVHQSLMQRESVSATLARLQRELYQIIGSG